MIFLLSILFFALALLLMSLGVILNGRRIQGSCGGLSAIPGIESDCGGACRSGSEQPEHVCHRRSEACPNRAGQACKSSSEAAPDLACARASQEE